MKTCNRCGQRKPDDKFHRVFASGKFYLHGYCKLCQRILARERWRRNRLLVQSNWTNTASAKPADSERLLPGCDQMAFGASLTTA